MTVVMTDAIEEGRPDDGRPSSPLPKSRKRLSWAWLGTVPFFAFIFVFLIWPTIVVGINAFKDQDGTTGTHNLGKALSGQYLRSFKTTASLSIITALLGGFIGIITGSVYLIVERICRTSRAI